MRSVLSPLPGASIANHTRQALTLMRLAGSHDEPETRALLNMGAVVHLSAARAAKAVRT